MFDRDSPIHSLVIIKRGQLLLERPPQKTALQTGRADSDELHSGTTQFAQVLLTESAVAGEEALFDLQPTWAYSLRAQSDKTVVFLIPIGILRTLPLRSLGRLREFHDQKLAFRRQLMCSKQKLSQTCLRPQQDKLVSEPPLLLQKTQFKFRRLVTEKSSLKSKSLAMQTIEKTRLERGQSPSSKQRPDDLLIFRESSSPPQFPLHKKEQTQRQAESGKSVPPLTRHGSDPSVLPKGAVEIALAAGAERQLMTHKRQQVSSPADVVAGTEGTGPDPAEQHPGSLAE